MCLQYIVAQHGFSAGVPSVFTEKPGFFFCSHGAWVSRCKTACRILNAWCRTPLSIFDFSSVVICCCPPPCSITGGNQKVKQCLRLMSTSRSVSKCRWWQTAFLIQCVLQPTHSLWTLSYLTNYLLIPCHWTTHKTHIFSLQSSLTLNMYITLITTPSIGSSRAYRQPSYSPSDPAGTCWTAARRACSPRRWEPTSCQGSHRRQMSMPPGTSRRWARWCPADAALASWSYREFSGPYGTGRPSALCGWKMMISIIYPQSSKCTPKTFLCFWVNFISNFVSSISFIWWHRVLTPYPVNPMNEFRRNENTETQTPSCVSSRYIRTDGSFRVYPAFISQVFQ